MTEEAARPSLMFHLGWRYVEPFVEKGLLRGSYLRFSRLLNVDMWLYQTGAVLGRARQERVDILARMFSEPGRESEVREFMWVLATERMTSYGRQPQSFFDFLMTTEYAKAGLVWPPPDMEAVRKITKAGDMKIPLAEVESIVKGHILEGIGFGSKFPEFTEQMWRATYETHDPDLWDRARAAGLDLPEQFEPVRLEEREQEVLVNVADYTAEYFPELVEPLGLQLH